MSLAESARQLAATLVVTGRQRLELAAVDVEEEVLRAGRAVAAMLAIAVLAALALAALSAAIVFALWTVSPLGALLGLAIAYGVAAWLLASRLMRSVRAKPAFLAATLGELGRDADSLQEARA